VKEYRRSVIVRDDNVERALRKFKKKIQESGLLDELRGRETYEKPTTERKRKKGRGPCQMAQKAERSTTAQEIVLIFLTRSKKSVINTLVDADGRVYTTVILA
jgi:small subunit ribosomal protein S21